MVRLGSSYLDLPSARMTLLLRLKTSATEFKYFGWQQKIRSISRRTCDQKVFPTDAFDSVSSRRLFVTRRSDDQRIECRMATAEFQQSAE